MRILIRQLTLILLISLNLIFGQLIFSNAKESIKNKSQKLSIEKIFQVTPIRGISPWIIKFSKSDRFLSFIWNNYDEMGHYFLRNKGGTHGYDLYIYDIEKKSFNRITSLEVMKPFHSEADHKKFISQRKQMEENEKQMEKIIRNQNKYLENQDIDPGKFEKEKIKQLREKWLSSKKENEKSKAEPKKWELLEKLYKEKNELEINDFYPGVQHYTWANSADELIFQYRGDLYRYFPVSNTINRLTHTEENESIVSYSKDDRGYFYKREEKIFHVKFNSSYLHHINPKTLIDKDFKIYKTEISPNRQWILIIASKQEGKPTGRDIHYMDYGKRFAKPVPLNREVADDPRNQPIYRFYLKKISDKPVDTKPSHVFQLPGGDVFYKISSISWSNDGSHYAFITIEQAKGELKIWVGKTLYQAKPELLFETLERYPYTYYHNYNIRFAPNNKHLLGVFYNEAGFKQPILFDIKTKEKREIIQGNFNSYPILGFSPNSQYVYLVSAPESPYINNIYKVSIKTGKMQKLGKEDGMHRTSAISNNGQWLGIVYGTWDLVSEFFLIDTKNNREKMLTHSHRPDWPQLNLIKPEPFNYKNRHGDTIYGIIFKPNDWKPEDKRPCITYVYGGPMYTATTIQKDYFSGPNYWFPEYMTVKHGYVTINISPRGETGFGRKFLEANWEKVGQPQVEDLEDLVKTLNNGYGVDTQKMGLWGWSFGGYQTMLTLFTSPNTFACGIAIASATEWENYKSWYTLATVGESRKGKPDQREYSLIPLAKYLKKPLLLIHGMMDSNVLFQDTIHVYQALIEEGKENLVELMIDPLGGHWLGGSITERTLFNKCQDFFLRHLGK